MLEIKDISKQYKTGNLIQKALDHVSLNLRDSEFVAILGPSGSGKTTLLNIIGGLDRYDSGDLIINGISTKKYKDRDWDSYRNHTIGFVFQSYNLIPHQSILANVELALTISGISRKERAERAKAALEEVGLGEQIHKKPNQLSGGQMQRVALARALVNNPDILLADEPTGALDSQTSVQVMDLLKQVAKDRLVVMVTHNPELAEQYATRIVNLKDGVIRSDSNPFKPKVSEEPPIHKNMGKSSMSFLTALSLSMNNLLTKKARTILVAFAGSIGIIGIALILSLSNGVNIFIQKTEEDTLSEYPLEIQKQTMDLSSMMTSSATSDDGEENGGDVQSIDMVSRMFSQVSSNDLGSLKDYLEDNREEVSQYARSIEYTYDVVPYIYQTNTENGVHQVNPDNVISSSGIAPTSSLYSFSTNSFTQLPENEELYIDAYEVKAGRWPTAYNEIVLVLNQSGTVSDVTLYVMGLRDYSEYEEIIQNFSSGKSNAQTTTAQSYDYEDFLNVTFKLVNSADTYVYDEDVGMWISRGDNEEQMKEIVANGQTLKVVGVVQPKADTDILMLTAGLNYPSSLQEYVISQSKNSAIVQEQIANPDIDVFTGKLFSDTNPTDIDLSSLFLIDENAFASAFQFDASQLSLATNAIDLSNVDVSNIDMSGMGNVDVTDILSNINVNTDHVDMGKIISDLTTAYLAQNPQYANSSQLFNQYLSDTGNTGAIAYLQQGLNAVIDDTERTNIQNVITQTSVDLMNAYLNSTYYPGASATDPLSGYNDFLQSDEARAIITQAASSAITLTDEDYQVTLGYVTQGFMNYANYSVDDISTSLQTFIQSDTAANIITTDLMSMIDMDDLESQINAQMAQYTSAMNQSIQSVMNQMMSAIQTSLTNSMNDLSTQMANAFRFDASALSNAFQLNGDADTLTSIMMSLSSSNRSSYETNLETLGYADLEDPSSIIIYPRDFETKQSLKDFIDDYNDKMRNSDQEEKVIVYTDLVGTMMSSVTDIVNVISYILIAFVAISLIVSSIMIGVITYISVLERQKEIGILRAIGASKRNISNVFNAETFITGFLAGMFGIGITELILIPGNILIHTLTGRNDVTAVLPWQAGIFLIILSIILTLIGGIIPSKKASNSDPVKALRTD